MRRLANELIDEGFCRLEVAETMRQGVSAHLEEFSPEGISVMQPMNRAGQRLIDSPSGTMPITVTPSDQFLCSREEFAEWASENTCKDGSLLMEDFYGGSVAVSTSSSTPTVSLWVGDGTTTTKRLRLQRGEHEWPAVIRRELDDVDAGHRLLTSVDGLVMKGEPPNGLGRQITTEQCSSCSTFCATRDEFGPYEDAIVGDEPHLNHSPLIRISTSGCCTLQR